MKEEGAANDALCDRKIRGLKKKKRGDLNLGSI